MILRELGGNDGHRTPPYQESIGWEFTATNGPYVAIGPRLFSSIAHVGLADVIQYRGEDYQRTSTVIEPPDLDMQQRCRFIVVDRDLPDWCDPFVSDEFSNIPQGGFIDGEFSVIGGGHGYGVIDDHPDGDVYHWGTIGTEALRWAKSKRIQYYGGTILLRFDEGAAASQDSGYGIFLRQSTGLKYLAALTGGHNPSQVGTFFGGIGIMGTWLYRELLKDLFAPRPLPPPPVISNEHLEFVFDVESSSEHDTIIESSLDRVEWRQEEIGRGNFQVRRLANDSQRFFRAKTAYQKNVVTRQYPAPPAPPAPPLPPIAEPPPPPPPP